MLWSCDLIPHISIQCVEICIHYENRRLYVSHLQELMKKPTLNIPTTKQMERLAEMEQVVAEQDTSLSSLTHSLKVLRSELETQRHVTASQAKEHAAQTAK